MFNDYNQRGKGVAVNRKFLMQETEKLTLEKYIIISNKLPLKHIL